MRRSFSAVVILTLCLQVVTSRALPQTASAEENPITTGLLGRVDESALAEVNAHNAAVGSSGWIGFKGTGLIVYESDPASYFAELSIQGDRRYRLDTQSKAGAASIRINAFQARRRDPDGGLSQVPVETAVTGIFPFELVRSFTTPDNTASLRDGGRVKVGTVTLHKVTLERQTLGTNTATNHPNTVSIDFYFDPVTHLLVQSSALDVVPGSRKVVLLTTVVYGDYRPVGTSLIPFRFTESVEGEPTRTIQLTEAELSPTFASGYFTF